MTAATLYEKPRLKPRAGETIVTSTCGHNCGGRCVVNAHVVDDRIVRISTDPRKWNPELPPLPACARGVGQIERTYHPDRLQYPMRRTGPRGSGAFERVTWDEALDAVAQELLRVREQHGNAAILDCSRSGTLSKLHGRGATKRFFNMFGGFTDLWSNMSAEAEIFGSAHDLRQGCRGQDLWPRADRLRQFEADRDVGLEPRRRHLRHRHAAISEARETAGRPHRLHRSTAHPHQPAARRRACLHPAVDRCRGTDRDGLCDRDGRPARSGLLRPLRPRFRRGASAGRRPGRCLLPFLPARRCRRRREDARMGGGDHRHPGRDDPPACDRDRHDQADRAAGRLRAGPNRLWRAVPPRALRAGGNHRQCRHLRRQFRDE